VWTHSISKISNIYTHIYIYRAYVQYVYLMVHLKSRHLILLLTLLHYKDDNVVLFEKRLRWTLFRKFCKIVCHCLIILISLRLIKQLIIFVNKYTNVQYSKESSESSQIKNITYNYNKSIRRLKNN